MLKIPKDVVVFVEEEGKWVAMNVFTRTCMGVEIAALDALRKVAEDGEDAAMKQFEKAVFQIWEIEMFSNYKGLLADPTRYLRSVSDWGSVRHEVRIAELIQRLKKHFLLIEDEAEYLKYFAPKKTLLDYEHLGNFHQQLGQDLLLNRRESPESWWVNQKFSEDFYEVKKNLYKAVQEYSLRTFFPRKFKAQDRVIDIGCGTGFYTNLMADTGASVLGVDPNENYVKLARSHAKKNGAHFEVLEVGKPDALDKIPSNSADYIFMSDALLFYFVPFSPKYTGQIEVLFRDIYRILKSEGTFISVEPNYIFWLLPWLGDVKRPFTIMTEYSEKIYGVTPTISRLIQAYVKGGFTVTWMEELFPDPSFESVDARAYNFGKEFPLWQLFELKKNPQ